MAQCLGVYGFQSAEDSGQRCRTEDLGKCLIKTVNTMPQNPKP